MPVRQTRSEALRARIVEEATKLFADRGLHATSVQDVADAVGISKQRLLYHFESKDTLHEQVVQAIAAEWKDLLPLLVEAAVDEREMPRRLDPLIAYFREKPHAARYVMRDLISAPRSAVGTLGEIVWPWMQQMAQGVEKGQREGRFDADCQPLPYMVLLGLLILTNVVVFEPSEGEEADPLGIKESVQKELERMMRASLRPPRVEPAT